MSQSFSVAKFGGTSVANFQAISKCVTLLIRRPESRVVVVSAAAGVTNLLVELAHRTHTPKDIESMLEQISAREYAILNLLQEPQRVEGKLRELLNELTQLALHEEINHRDNLKDQLLSIGERMSSLLFCEALRENGVDAINFDIRNVLVTDDTYGEAKPDLSAIEENASRLLKPQISEQVIVTQGFIGGTASGETTTLGRGGSDYSAALLAEALGASSCDIWTDVDGVYTTDPRLTEKARRIDELSFEEAAEMATFGAKVLHPATMEPAVRKNIQVYVGSSSAPENGGTKLLKNCSHKPKFRAITRRSEQVMVTVKTPKMMHAQGFLQKVFSIIAKNELSVDLVTTSEISVSFTLDNPADSVAQKLNQRTIAELEGICEVSVESGYDLVTVVGNRMQSELGVASTIFSVLQDTSVRMVCFGANPHNMSILVNASESADIVRSLHDALFASAL